MAKSPPVENAVAATIAAWRRLKSNPSLRRRLRSQTAPTRRNRPLPTSLGLTTSLVEGSVGPRSHGPCERACGPCAEGALMWDSPSVVAGEEGRSSPVPNDRRGRRPHHSGAGLLRPVIPATCATVSLVTGTAAPEKSVSKNESDGRNRIVCSRLCRLPPRPTRVVLPTGRKPSLLEAGGSASKDAEVGDKRR